MGRLIYITLWLRHLIKTQENKGVVVVMNENILDAKDVIKHHTTAVETFTGANSGKIGYIHNWESLFQ